MSFRWKVRLLFLGAVIVPLAAIGVVLIALQEQSRHAQVSSELSQGLENFRKLYAAARDDARLAVEDPSLTRAIARGRRGQVGSRIGVRPGFSGRPVNIRPITERRRPLRSNWLGIFLSS